MKNRSIMEYFVIAIIIGLGSPICALLGVSDGEKLGAHAWPVVEKSTAMPIDYKALVLGSAADVDKGKALFQANCIACHGPNADGKGVAAASLTPAPRNFQDPAAKWTRSREPLDIYQTLSNGSPGTAMVGFAAALSVQDRWALVHFLGTQDGVRGHFKPIDDAMASSWRPDGKP